MLPNSGSKRTLTSLYKSLEELGVSSKEVEERVCDVVRKTVIVLEPFVTQEFYAAFGSKHPDRCFHILGFDILISESHKAWLLEINANPSMSIKGEEEPEVSPVDIFVKTQVVENALKIVAAGKLGEELKAHSCYLKLLPLETPSPYSKFDALKKVVGIFTALQTIKVCGTINLFKFCQLAKYIPSKALAIERYEYSLVYTQIAKQKHYMDLALFMDALKLLAEKIFKEGTDLEKLFKLLKALEWK